MIWIILSQLGLAAVLGVLALLLGGKVAGISSVLASLSCVIPNAILAVGLVLVDKKWPKKGAHAFLVLEFAKIVLTILLVVSAFKYYGEVNWFSFIVSYIVIIKSYIFLLSRFKF